ncbi:MAG: ribosome biogenesis GTPase Der [Actinomycetota bacterium]|nr:ribosome biogenesis GTPase Der [Actinomycetota bacterium]
MSEEFPTGDEIETWDVDDAIAGALDGDVSDDALTQQAEAAARAEFGDLEAELSAMERAAGSAQLPTLAIIGRPNVGKSTLVNRILGRREAVVEDVPGVTRDRVSYDAEWNGKHFLVMDTGGWDTKARGLGAQIAGQAKRALTEADAVLFVIDATVGATDADEEVAKVLQRADVPVMVVANKSDDSETEMAAAALWSLGLGEPFPTSALHGRRAGDLLDEIVKMLPEKGKGLGREGGPRRVALLGRPNVGKSSLLNKLAGSERVVVDDVAGTTVDPVDELVDIKGTWWWFVDTAGVRRKAKQSSGHEYYATLRTQGALERSEVAMVLIDSSEPVSEQDVRILSMVVDAGRALVLAFNKWDLVDEDRRRYLDREIDRDLNMVAWAPRVNVSALTGRHMDKLTVALEQALEGWETRISTGRLNKFLAELAGAHPHPVRGGKQPRILFATQVGVGPPSFALFTTGFLEAGYRRFIERRLREEFGFTGTPLRLMMRVREKRRR